MSSKVDLADEWDEIRDLSQDRKNQRQVIKAKNSINSTLDSFSKQIDDLTLLRNELRTKVQAKKKDLAKIKQDIVLEKEGVTKLNKQIIVIQNQQNKINGDSADLYKQVENIAKSYVEKESSISQILEKLQSKEQ